MSIALFLSELNVGERDGIEVIVGERDEAIAKTAQELGSGAFGTCAEPAPPPGMGGEGEHRPITFLISRNTEGRCGLHAFGVADKRTAYLGDRQP